MKLNLIFIAVALISIALNVESASKEKSSEISIECTVGSVLYTFFKTQPTCTLKSTPSITKKNTKIIAVGKDCDAGKPNTVVKIFYALKKVIRFFPLGLDILFPNLIGFRFESTQLQMITKEDLQPFPNILMFACVGNQIQFIEQDLFMYNVKLQYVSLRSNRITYIDPTVFNVIKATLQYMFMESQAISCGIGDATSASAVSKAIDKLSNSACADISNAPPLYILLVELKIQLSECQEKSETTTAASDSTTESGSSTASDSTTESGSSTASDSTTEPGSSTASDSTTESGSSTASDSTTESGSSTASDSTTDSTTESTTLSTP